jgi:hypothetical protein
MGVLGSIRKSELLGCIMTVDTEQEVKEGKPQKIEGSRVDKKIMLPICFFFFFCNMEYYELKLVLNFFEVKILSIT